MPAPRFALLPGALSADALTAAVVAEAERPVGAISTFLGLVRGVNQGRRVSWLDYEAYEPMALNALARIDSEARDLWPSVILGVHHRTGRVEVGEASIAIVAASPHRAEAFAASRYVIERVKQIAPIWKHEHFDGGEVWVEGATTHPDDAAARDEARRRACA
jgi:molybdopterin synthase catalytic subunit